MSIFSIFHMDKKKLGLKGRCTDLKFIFIRWPERAAVDFPFFSQIFPMFAMLNVIFDPFLTGKTPFFTLFILSRTSDNSTSLNIGGTNAWAVPTSNFGGPSPITP